MESEPRSAKPNERATKIEVGTGNVFADFGILHPDLAQVKANLVQRIREIIAERKLTQTRAAALLDIDQPKVSAIVRGDVYGYILDRLFRLLNALGQRVEITLSTVGSPSGSRNGLSEEDTCGILVLQQ